MNPNAYEFMMLKYTAGSEEIVLDIFQLNFKIRGWIVSNILLLTYYKYELVCICILLRVSWAIYLLRKQEADNTLCV